MGEESIGNICLQNGFHKSTRILKKVFDVIFEGTRNDYHIVDVESHERKFTKDCMREMTKGPRGVYGSHRHIKDEERPKTYHK